MKIERPLVGMLSLVLCLVTMSSMALGSTQTRALDEAEAAVQWLGFANIERAAAVASKNDAVAAANQVPAARGEAVANMVAAGMSQSQIAANLASIDAAIAAGDLKLSACTSCLFVGDAWRNVGAAAFEQYLIAASEHDWSEALWRAEDASSGYAQAFDFYTLADTKGQEAESQYLGAIALCELY